jgi:hypothetical protein
MLIRHWMGFGEYNSKNKGRKIQFEIVVVGDVALHQGAILDEWRLQLSVQ